MPLVISRSSLQGGDMDRRPHFDTESRRGSMTGCPDCGGSRTVTVREVDIVAFLCEDCGACWRVELGYVHRLKPPPEPVADD